jgi:hypothetical protein
MLYPAELRGRHDWFSRSQSPLQSGGARRIDDAHRLGQGGTGTGISFADFN